MRKKNILGDFCYSLVALIGIGYTLMGFNSENGTDMYKVTMGVGVFAIAVYCLYKLNNDENDGAKE